MHYRYITVLNHVNASFQYNACIAKTMIIKPRNTHIKY